MDDATPIIQPPASRRHPQNARLGQHEPQLMFANSPATTQRRPASCWSTPMTIPPLTTRHPQERRNTCAASPLEGTEMTTTLEAPAEEEVVLDDPFLRMSAAILDDIEMVRIGNENRLRQLTRDVTDVDGEERGFGLTEDHEAVVSLRGLVDSLAAAELSAIKNLERRMKKNPLWNWGAEQRGIGAKQMARLLASIGDPYIRPEMLNKESGEVQPSRPRMVSELYAYCGMHLLDLDEEGNVLARQTGTENQTAPAARVAPFRRKGVRSNWNPDARTRIRLIADSCMKQPSGSTWRDVYEAGREKYADSVHAAMCLRCGPKGKPALKGSALSLAHQDARARRLVAKGILRELWVQAGQLHGVDMEEELRVQEAKWRPAS